MNSKSIPINKTTRRAKIKKIGLILVVFALLVGDASTGQSPKLGDYAPEFSLVDVSGNEVRLSDFKGKRNVALIFYAEHS
jgi:cytochrome oxidase Cu insertion factor (SCO1/SenC/PrrC family)